MAPASSTRPGRSAPPGFLPRIHPHWSAPSEDDAGFAIDLWAEHPVDIGDLSDLQSAARLLVAPTLMTNPARIRGLVAVDASRLVVSVFMTGPGSFSSVMRSLAENGLEDLWHAIHLATRPEGSHLRTGEHLLAMARVRRAMA